MMQGQWLSKCKKLVINNGLRDDLYLFRAIIFIVEMLDFLLLVVSSATLVKELFIMVMTCKSVLVSSSFSFGSFSTSS
jgi:hypothetical protein